MNIVKPIAMRDAFLEQIWRKMSTDETVFFCTADFGSPVLDKIRADFPKRFVNVGIAEQNLINVSVGLALEGHKVFAYAIAPFITMRCYEQIRVSIALLSTVRPMNISLIGVGAGYSYVVSGPTHQCYEDITLMRAMPNMHVLSPADQVTAAAMIDTCINEMGPKYLRFDAQIFPAVYEQAPDLSKGFHVHQSGRDLCMVATGFMLQTTFKVAEKLRAQGLDVGVVDLFDLSHFSGDALAAELSKSKGLVSLEEGFRGRGGMDAMLFDFIARRGLNSRLLNIGVEGAYSWELGTRAQLHEHVGIGPDAVLASVSTFLKTLSARSAS